LAKKPSPPKQARKRTAAEQARSTFDADPSPPSDAELADLIQQQRPIVETQRPPPSHRILSREEILARVDEPRLVALVRGGELKVDDVGDLTREEWQAFASRVRQRMDDREHERFARLNRSINR